MHSSEDRVEFNGPYKDLHVYLLQGVVTQADETGLGKHFLGTWLEGETSFLFFTVPSRDKINDLVQRRPLLSFFEEHDFSYEEWQGTRLEPVRISPFLIRSPWDKTGARESDLDIVLDPGVVFGTGIHPTTRDCLRALAYLRKKGAFEKVIDLGTGTGILALAAARLGAKRVLAVDLNPLCVKTSKRNIELNHLESVIEVLEGDAEDLLDKAADLVVANIHFEVLKEMVEKKSFRKTPWLILSGLMRSQGRDIKARLERWGLTVVREWDGEGTWVTMLASARSDGIVE
jgi:ribosomal protein L11 methyltransferase